MREKHATFPAIKAQLGASYRLVALETGDVYKKGYSALSVYPVLCASLIFVYPFAVKCITFLVAPPAFNVLD